MEERTKELVKKKEYILVKYIWAILLACLIPVLGALILFYRAFVNFRKKHTTFYKEETKGIYVKDKRFKSGARYEGSRKHNTPVKVKININEKKIAKYKGIGYLIIGIASIIIYRFYGSIYSLFNY